MSHGEARRGAALLLALLLVLATTAVGHAALLLALADRSAAYGAAAHLQARVLAERGVTLRVRTLRAAGDSALGGSTDLELGAAGFVTEARRLGPELLLVEAVGTAALAPGSARRARAAAARVLWRLDPERRVAGIAAVLESGAGVDGVERVDGSHVTRNEDGSALEACRQDSDALARVAPSGRLPATDRIGEGETGIPGLGPLPGDSLLVRLPPFAPGTVTPEPATISGACIEGANPNWGSPLEPSGPCGSRRVAVGVPGDLVISGGQGQGLLLVRGSLRLTDGARFAGLVLVGGDLIVEAGAGLHGLARVAGGVLISPDAAVVGDACSTLLALRQAAALRDLWPLPGGGWILPL